MRYQRDIRYSHVYGIQEPLKLSQAPCFDVIPEHCLSQATRQTCSPVEFGWNGFVNFIGSVL